MSYKHSVTGEKNLRIREELEEERHRQMARCLLYVVLEKVDEDCIQICDPLTICQWPHRVNNVIKFAAQTFTPGLRSDAAASLQ